MEKLCDITVQDGVTYRIPLDPLMKIKTPADMHCPIATVSIGIFEATITSTKANAECSNPPSVFNRMVIFSGLFLR